MKSPELFSTIEIEELTSKIVVKTLSQLGLLSSKYSNPRVYRTEMVKMIGRRAYDNAVRDGKLHPFKEDLNRKTAKVWVERKEWDKFLKLYARNAA